MVAAGNFDSSAASNGGIGIGNGHITEQDALMMAQGTPALYSNDCRFPMGGAAAGQLLPLDKAGSSSEEEVQTPSVWRWKSEVDALVDMFRSKRISFLLIAIPLAPMSALLEWNDTYIFLCNFVPMIALAALLGDFTEVIAHNVGDKLGGFVSASLGNTAEVVVAIQALRADELSIVQISLLGSIMSNLLVVLGTAFFAGGLFSVSGNKQQSFCHVSAVANTSLLLLSCLSLAVPAQVASYDISEADSLTISRVFSILMLLMYAQFMAFQFNTHSFLFLHEKEKDGTFPVDVPNLHLATATGGLGVAATLIAIFSANLVGSIDGFSEQSKIPKTFTGFILIPMIGNVVEYLVATTVAAKDKMELAMGIAVGSACQGATFVFPMVVLIAWGMDKDLTLIFPKYDLLVYAVGVIIVAHLVAKGSCNWLEGSTLVTSYLMIGVGFWFLPHRD